MLMKGIDKVANIQIYPSLKAELLIVITDDKGKENYFFLDQKLKK